MKDVAIIVVLTVALGAVLPAAGAALALFFDMGVLLRSTLAGFFAGLLFSFLVLYAVAYNTLVEADRRRGHERVDTEHDGRRI